jgi:hypothetical protein
VDRTGFNTRHGGEMTRAPTMGGVIMTSGASLFEQGYGTRRYLWRDKDKVTSLSG